MAYFSPIEMARMLGVRDDVRAKALQLMNAFEAQTGRHLYVPADGGFRTHARQQQLYDWSVQDAANGDVYKTAPPGESAHEWGAGFDLHVVGSDQPGDYELLAQIAESPAIGLRAGIHFGDPYHFEAPESLAVWKAKFADYAGRTLPERALVFVGLIAALVYASR